MFLLALLKIKTVNLSELSLEFGGLALPASNHKHLQRFFRGFDLDYAVIAKAIVDWMKIPRLWVLSKDRITWEFGCHIYNILTIGVVHEGVALPWLWWMRGKKGNSDDEPLWC